jgi:post-segregation antitoxin (ccd killing protein)
MQMSNKHNLVLYVDQELVEKTRNLGFNLSKTFENYLKHLLNQFSSVNLVNNHESLNDKALWWAGPDLNRRPLARKANVLTKLDDRPSIFPKSKQLLLSFGSIFLWSIGSMFQYCMDCLGFLMSDSCRFLIIDMNAKFYRLLALEAESGSVVVSNVNA